MGLWKKVTGIIKDKNSIVWANFSGKSSFRNPDLEISIIKATSHDEYHIDKRNAQIVFSWIRASPISLRPLVWALSRRMEKTRSWVVAVKGLMLMHGVFYCKVPAVEKMGRLPFDLSSFTDGHTTSGKTWGFNAFVREYYAFLDQQALVLTEKDNRKSDERSPMAQQLSKLQKLQYLLDMLLQVKPRAENMKLPLILEAMDCIIIEIYDVYSRICTEITKVLLNIYSVKKPEAATALKVLQKAMTQGEELSLFFESCKEFGVMNANEFPTVAQIPKEEVEELERIVNGASDMTMTTYEDSVGDYSIEENDETAAIVEHKEALKTRRASIRPARRKEKTGKPESANRGEKAASTDERDITAYSTGAILVTKERAFFLSFSPGAYENA
ncbi:putative clathrin assembly protein At1g25240 [Gossypium hirsutum]|uniref:Clathrin assembly protein At1g25240 n=1 Tax=Gossypium hirsutum TaxID=3635 RepID=A0ABM3BJG6_GOSHI|nr:putative clathrin assembly protein At1g25240 [Gossypium hirsutum]